MHFVGIHSEGSILYIATLKKRGKNFEILSLKKEGSVKRFYIPKGSECTTGLSSNEALLRQLPIKLKSKRHIRQALPFQLENLIPFPAKETIAAPIISRNMVSVVATSKGALEAHLLQMKKVNIDPDSVSYQPIALHRWACYLYPDLHTFLTIYIGEESSCVVAIVDDRILFSKTLSIGSASITQALKRDKSKKVDIDQITQSSHPSLYTVITKFKRELTRLKDSIEKNWAHIKLSDLVITGQVDSPLKLDDFISNELKCHSLYPPLMTAQPIEEMRSFSVAIGLALEGSRRGKDAIQFRTGEYQAASRKKRLRYALFSFTAACLLLVGATSLLSMQLIKKREAKLSQLLSRFSNESINEVSILTTDEIRKTLDDWNHQLKSASFVMPARLNVPNVSEVLIWISQMPSLNEAYISNFIYYLPSYPKLSEKRASYHAQVDLDITVESRAQSEVIYQALISNTELVERVDWSGEAPNYRASIKLKARSQ